VKQGRITKEEAIIKSGNAQLFEIGVPVPGGKVVPIEPDPKRRTG
jgi:hypothetical protein